MSTHPINTLSLVLFNTYDDIFRVGNVWSERMKEMDEIHNYVSVSRALLANHLGSDGYIGHATCIVRRIWVTGCLLRTSSYAAHPI